jgi:hypothetical protein
LERKQDFTFVHKRPLYVYVIGVAVVWAAILCAVWFMGDAARFNILVLVCLGFAIGMLAMYIATRVYKSVVGDRRCV